MHLEGYISSTSDVPQSVIFTLPEGYRPTKEACYPSINQTGLDPTIIPICVNSDGTVREPDNYDKAVHATLDGITFRAGTG